jgi:L-ascorbate metabolism protein UlaG (beta-lactamase superfamily)
MLKSNAFFCLLLGFPLTACATGNSNSDPRLRSSHFHDGAFRNVHSPEGHSFWDYLKMRMKTEHAKWPDWVETETDDAPAARIDGPEIRVTFINHSTFLIQTAGFNILTDPVFANRASPFSFAGPKRVHKPGITFEKLPKIDVVIISHDHYDHLDIENLEKLISRDNPKLYMGLGVANRLKNRAMATELDWWESIQVAEGFRLTFTEVQHFSGRSLTDRNSTLWGGFVLEISGKKIYFGGDSGYAPHYLKTSEKFGAIDLAFLPIGAYAPREFMRIAHMDPKQAVQAHLDLKSKQSIGMHYGCFPMAAESAEEPLILLEKERSSAKVHEKEFVTLPVGKYKSFPAAL